MNEWNQKKKLLFIYNPRAGKEKIRSNFLDIIDIFAKADYEITVYPTQSQGDGRKAVVERKKKFFDLIVCCRRAVPFRLRRAQRWRQVRSAALWVRMRQGQAALRRLP